MVSENFGQQSRTFEQGERTDWCRLVELSELLDKGKTCDIRRTQFSSALIDTKKLLTSS
jgi:hypothetical protein